MCHTAKGPGGGIYNASSAILNITNSTVSGNTAADGSGIANQGTATVNSSTVSNNTASYTGGGIYNLNLLTITNSTISSNRADFAAGGIYNMNTGVLKITNSTVSSNSASLSSNGIYNCGAMTLVNSVLANSSGKDYCSASATSDSHHNLIADANNSCGFTDGVNDNIVGKDPRLGPLQDNGGPTQTHALLAGSPAFDTASAADCPSTDQRGEERPQDAGCDIGAYERKQPDPDSTAPTANPSQSPAAADSTRMPARPAAHPAARARSR